MIAIFSDTHSSHGHELEGPALEAVREAEAVIHAGDFNSKAALEAFQAESSRLYGVYGNTDSMSVCDRLPEARTVEHDGLRIAVTHRRDGGQTGLRMFGRSREADLVVSGHTHRPTVIETSDCVLLNPGSHAEPRGNRPGFATLERTDSGVEGRLLDLEESVVETFAIDLQNENS